jgi:hypothetical protein
MGSPSQLSISQVKLLKEQNSDEPIVKKIVQVNSSGQLDEKFPIRQNDVVLIKIYQVASAGN